jgi:type I restriction enzyme, R subunit
LKNSARSRKPAGLIVDYIGIAQNLMNALGQYSGSDQRQTGIDEAKAVAALLQQYGQGNVSWFRLRAQRGGPHERLAVLAGAIEWALDRQHEAAAKETSEDGKRRENRRYHDAVLALSKAFALASASDETRDLRDKVGFFQTVRAALVNSSDGAGNGAADREFAIQHHDTRYLDAAHNARYRFERIEWGSSMLVTQVGLIDAATAALLLSNDFAHVLY